MNIWSRRFSQTLHWTRSDKNQKHHPRRTRPAVKSRERETKSWTSLDNHTFMERRTHHLHLVRATKWSFCRFPLIISSSCFWIVSCKRSLSTSYKKKAKTSSWKTLLTHKNLRSSLFSNMTSSSTTLLFSSTCTRLRSTQSNIIVIIWARLKSTTLALLKWYMLSTCHRKMRIACLLTAE